MIAKYRSPASSSSTLAPDTIPIRSTCSRVRLSATLPKLSTYKSVATRHPSATSRLGDVETDERLGIERRAQLLERNAEREMRGRGAEEIAPVECA